LKLEKLEKQDTPTDWARLQHGGVAIKPSFPGCETHNLPLNNAVNGDLEGNCVADGRWFDIYTFSGLAGQPISISMSSSVFNTYLYLLSPSGAFIAEDDNGGGGTNARIPSGSGTFALPSTGTYTVYATSFFANETGGYTITLSGPPLN